MAKDSTTSQAHTPGSVSRLIPDLKEGDRHAMERLWQCYFEPLVRLARRRLHPGHCRVAGPEDVVLEAFLDFCDRLARPDADRKFPRLQSREHLWKLLACFTVRTAFDFNHKQARQHGIVRGESALGDEGFAPLAGREPAPEFTVAVTDLLDQLRDETLRTVAVRTMAGCTVAEIARELDCSPSTVERKLRAIRAIWQARASTGP